MDGLCTADAAHIKTILHITTTIDVLAARIYSHI